MIDPTLLTCAHRRCRHLTKEGHCGLLASGQRILLNARGQCEMVEYADGVTNTDAPAGSTCVRHHCRNPAASLCTRCRKPVCAQHRTWVPNGLVGVAGDLEQEPYCDVCTMRFIRQIAGDDVQPPLSDRTVRDDYDDPEDPWQPV